MKRTVIPAEAGIQSGAAWTPASAGVTASRARSAVALATGLF
jgi:hypothetical protein